MEQKATEKNTRKSPVIPKDPILRLIGDPSAKYRVGKRRAQHVSRTHMSPDISDSSSSELVLSSSSESEVSSTTSESLGFEVIVVVKDCKTKQKASSGVVEN